ncbi:MAG: hypothetical protein LBR23_07790 [Spirochaetaceae bacterium]|jgi:hypothetical protein|nr:hypothetical protein [Spirochaetaceae bacterium]
MKRLSLVLVVLSFALPGFAQTYSYRMSWSPVPAARRYRVVVEKLEADWIVAIEFETAALWANLSLEQGEYRYQVTGKDILGLLGEPSQWVAFTVSPPEDAPEPQAPGAETGGEPRVPPPAEGGGGESRASRPAGDAGLQGEESAEAQPEAGAFAAAAGAEVNLLDLGKSFAVGCSLTGEWRFSRSLSAGGFFLASFGIAELFTLESGVFMRWYFFRPGAVPLEIFLEGALGAAAVMRNASPGDSLGLVDAGLSAGMRYFLGKFYAEPYVRAGYPFLTGAGVRFGYANGRPQ